MAEAHIVELVDVTKVHSADTAPVQALRGVSLTLAAGEMLAVMGPSGSGKSTLLNLVGTLDEPTTGKVVVEGTDLAGLSPTRRAELRRRHVGFVFQDFNLVPTLSASENVALPLSLDGVPWRKARPVACAALAEVGIEPAADRFPDELSGGERQRVAVARALIGDRRLMLADEPTGALDSATGEDVLALLRRRCDEGAACILVTHESRHAAWADRILLLRDGLIVDHTEYRGVGADLIGAHR